MPRWLFYPNLPLASHVNRGLTTKTLTTTRLLLPNRNLNFAGQSERSKASHESRRSPALDLLTAVSEAAIARWSAQPRWIIPQLAGAAVRGATFFLICHCWEQNIRQRTAIRMLNQHAPELGHGIGEKPGIPTHDAREAEEGETQPKLRRPPLYSIL